MAEGTGFLPGLSPVCRKPVRVAFGAGQLTSDAGVLLLAEVDRLLIHTAAYWLPNTLRDLAPKA